MTCGRLCEQKKYPGKWGVCRNMDPKFKRLETQNECDCICLGGWLETLQFLDRETPASILTLQFLDRETPTTFPLQFLDRETPVTKMILQFLDRETPVTKMILQFLDRETRAITNHPDFI